MVKIILFFLLTLPLLIIDPPVFTFVMVSMFPAFVALMVDIRPEKSTGMTVAFFNLAGLVRYLVPMLEDIGTNKFSNALSVVNFFVVYIFAAIGYFVVWLVPRIFVLYADYKNQTRARIISERMAKLIEEWGSEVRQ